MLFTSPESDYAKVILVKYSPYKVIQCNWLNIHCTRQKEEWDSDTVVWILGESRRG